MTDGRFEEINSIRPNNWDQRRLWCERPQFQKLDPEIRYDESCPFHDLKADGCFQPEYGLMHDNEKRIEPDALTKRKDGNRMRMGGPQAKHNGMGGYLMPVDTAAPRAVSAPKLAGRPWGTGGKIGLFSRPEYIACPAPPGARSISTAPRAAPYSGAIKLGAPVPYMPDDRTAAPKSNRWRLATGTYNAKALPPVLPALPAKAEDVAAVPLPVRRDPFHNPHHGGAFGQHPTHMPTPYKDCPDRRRAGGALFTYAAKSKRTAPVQVPWSTLIQTADPSKDYPRQDTGFGNQTGGDFAKQTSVHHGSQGNGSPVYERQASGKNEFGQSSNNKFSSLKQGSGVSGYEKPSFQSKGFERQISSNGKQQPSITHGNLSHTSGQPSHGSAKHGFSSSMQNQSPVRRDYGAGYEKRGYVDA